MAGDDPKSTAVAAAETSHPVGAPARGGTVEVAPKAPQIIYRAFAADVMALAPEWRKTMTTTDDWRPNGRKFGGESQTLGVTNGKRNDVAKPGKRVTHHYAAHEKIVSDLAFELDLPVPPGILWERAGAAASEHRWCYISAFAFDRPRKFAEVGRKIPPEKRGYAQEAASAIVALDWWVGVEDRNDDNLIVDGDFTSAQPIACLDYSWSLSKNWTKGNYPRQIIDRYAPELGGTLESEKRRTADKICALDRTVIERIVMRIATDASDFLPLPSAEIILLGLIDGQGTIHKVLGS